MSRKGRKFKNRPPQHQQQQRPQPKPEVLPALDMGFLNAATVTTREFEYVQIVLAGAGGNGAFLAQHVGRLMRVLYADVNGAHLTICDPDTVEEKNIGRQNFCDAEVGMPKAEAVARRYGRAWGLNTTAYHGDFDEKVLIGMDTTILVGCVDNAAARASLHETLRHNEDTPDGRPNFWWLDLGNLRETGRVLLGSAYDRLQARGAFPSPQECVKLPSPALQFRDLLTPRPEELAGAEMSCAEMAAANLQSLTINCRLAAEAADFLMRLLVTRDLKRFACEINLAAGSMKSTYATPESVTQSMKAS